MEKFSLVEYILLIFIISVLGLAIYATREVSIPGTSTKTVDVTPHENVITLPNKALLKSARYIDRPMVLNIEIQIIDDNQKNWILLYHKTGELITKTKIQ